MEGHQQNNCLSKGFFAPSLPTYVTQVTENEISIGEENDSSFDSDFRKNGSQERKSLVPVMMSQEISPSFVAHALLDRNKHEADITLQNLEPIKPENMMMVNKIPCLVPTVGMSSLIGRKNIPKTTRSCEKVMTFTDVNPELIKSSVKNQSFSV